MATSVQLPLTDPEWGSFVAAHPDAHPFHLPEWASMVAECYRLDGFVVAMRNDAGAIVAGIPVIATRRPLGRRRLVALPFTDICPPLAIDDAALVPLARSLDDARAAMGADRVVVRGPMPAATSVADAGYRHVLELEPDPEAVYARFHHSQVQRSIRRAEASDLAVRVSTPARDLLDDFYALHLATRRRLGVPIQPRRFFRLLRERILDREIGWIVTVEAAGRPIAAAMFLAARRTVVYKFGASEAGAWQLRPNHLLLWHAIRAACEAGQVRFDFGRSDPDADGLRAFKASWGAAEEPLHYHAIGGQPDWGDRTAAAPGVARRVMGATIRRGPPWVCRLSGELLYRFVA